MKSIIATIAILIWMCATPTHAQDWQFGAHIGATYSKMLWADKVEDSPWLTIQYPETAFRPSYAVGITSGYSYSERFYSPFQLDFYNKRFAIATGGVVQAVDENGQFLFIQADYLDYQLNQLAFSVGIGYNVWESLAVEVMPYIHYSLGTQKIKIADVIDWREDLTFQQDSDFGISGYLRAGVGHVYAKAGYQYGLKRIEEYGAFDANGESLGKFPIRNTMFLLIVGYSL